MSKATELRPSKPEVHLALHSGDSRRPARLDLIAFPPAQYIPMFDYDLMRMSTTPGSCSLGSAASCGTTAVPSPNAIIDESPLAPRSATAAFFTRWFGLDLRSLALMRFSMGVIILADILQRALYLRAHYTDEGVLPRQMLIQHLGDGLFWSLHNLSGDFYVVSILFVAAFVFAAMFTVGYRTRLATVMTWILTVSVINRNPLVGQAGDVLLRLMLLWSCFLPLGARWSIDSACNSNPRPKDNALLSAGTFAFIGQVCVMYWFAAIMKWAPTWLEGQAVYYALHCDMYCNAAGIWLRQFESVLPLLTYSAIAFEIGGPALAIFPFFVNQVRLFAVVLMVCVHIGFGFFLSVGIFSPIAIVFWLTLLPGGFWDWLFKRLATPKRLGTIIYLDGNCSFCWRVAMVLKTLFLLPQTQVRVCQSDPEIEAMMHAENSWIVVDHTGNRHIRADALAHVFSVSPIAFPLAWLIRMPGLAGLADKTYRYVAHHRGEMSLVTAMLKPRPLKTNYGKLSGAFVLVAFLCTIPVNFNSLDPNNLAPPPANELAHSAKKAMRRIYEVARVPVGILQLEQNWAMYAPSPMRSDGWFIAEGFLSDGSRVDLLNGNSPVNWERPEVIASTFPTHRWQKYLENMSRDGYGSCRAGLCRYLCRQWNQSHKETQRVLIIKFWFMKEETTEHEILKPERVLLRVHSCSDMPNAIETVAEPPGE